MEESGYYWAEDEFNDIILVFLNVNGDGLITVKDMTKEMVYSNISDLRLIEKINLPKDYDDVKDAQENMKSFTRKRLNFLYAGIAFAFITSLVASIVLHHTYLIPGTFFGTTITLITNIVIMAITIGLWRWKIFAEEKIGNSVNVLSDTIDKIEGAGLTLSRISDFEPVMVAVAEGIGSMNEDEIKQSAEFIRNFFAGMKDMNDSGWDIKEQNADKMMEEWKKTNGGIE